MSTYWTMDDKDGLPSVTLCEEHALYATNIGCQLFGLGPWDTMQAAAAELDALTAIFSAAGSVGFDFSSDEVGPCEQCELEREQTRESA